MANLLNLLAPALTTAVRADTARMEGQRVGEERQQASLLARIKQEQEAADRASRQQLQDAQTKNLLDQIRERSEVKPIAPDLRIHGDAVVDMGTATAMPIAGMPQSTAPKYEERTEPNGGVAVYKDGQFSTWKIRPPQERDSGVAQALAANRQFQREQALRGDFQQEPVVKQAGALASAVAQLRASAEEKTPQGDLNMLYGAVKLRDPNAVREGELALNNKARSAHTQLFAMWDRVQNGRILTDDERAQVMSLVEQMIAQQTKLVEPVQRLFGQKSRQYGADSAFVARDPFEGVRGAGAADPFVKYGLTPAPVRRP